MQDKKDTIVRKLCLLGSVQSTRWTFPDEGFIINVNKIVVAFVVILFFKLQPAIFPSGLTKFYCLILVAGT